MPVPDPTSATTSPAQHALALEQVEQLRRDTSGVGARSRDAAGEALGRIASYDPPARDARRR